MLMVDNNKVVCQCGKVRDISKRLNHIVRQAKKEVAKEIFAKLDSGVGFEHYKQIAKEYGIK